jgi:hypothetical protein
VTHMVYVCLSHNSSTNWAFLFLWETEVIEAPKLILFLMTLHKPISIQANKMKPVEALIDASKVTPIGESLCFDKFFVVAKVFKANGAAASYCIVVF